MKGPISVPEDRHRNLKLRSKVSAHEGGVTRDIEARRNRAEGGREDSSAGAGEPHMSMITTEAVLAGTGAECERDVTPRVTVRGRGR